MKHEFSFGESLLELRRDRRIGQVELAQAIGVSKGIVSLWEHGKREPTLSNLLALADFFQVSLDVLVGRSV